MVKEVCRTLKKDDSAAMPDTYLTAMQNAFQRHLADDQSRQSLQNFTTMCTRVAQTYAGFNASATALLHIAKVTDCGTGLCPAQVVHSMGLSAVSCIKLWLASDCKCEDAKLLCMDHLVAYKTYPLVFLLPSPAPV